MTIGLAPGLATSLLGTLIGTSFSNANIWAQLHIGDPGVAGTANTSVVTTREQLSAWTNASGTLAISASPTAWNMTATETIVSISLWSASSGGTFLWSATLAVSKTVANGDTLTLNTCSLSFAPLAA
jgi:hypothetical protein